MRLVRFRSLLLAGVLLSTMAAPPPSHAAQSYDNCTGFIDALPATISTQGTWCLRKDLTSSLSYGNAITVAANNITIDCNDFKLGGLPGGSGTWVNGIHAEGRSNITVRHCTIRGFIRGIFLLNYFGSGGHVVEDNRLDSNTYVGLWVDGDGSVVRRNLVRDTGGTTAVSMSGDAFAITAGGTVDILDNIVDGVLPSPDNNWVGRAIGISTYNTTGSVAGNGIRGLVPLGGGEAFGIRILGTSRAHLRNNDLSNTGNSGTGLECSDGNSRALRNMINGFTTPIDGCRDDGNSL